MVANAQGDVSASSLEGISTPGIALAPLPCGIVLFDDPMLTAGGTAYLPCTPPERIRSPNDLRNDALWVSNAPAYEQRVRSHPTLRSSYYFRTTLPGLFSDVGIQCSRDGQTMPEDAERMATFFTRTMTIAARAYGWDIAEDGPLRVREDMLYRDIAKMLPQAPQPDADSRTELDRALMQAYQAASEPDWPSYRFEADCVFVTLRYNRVNYARQILSAPIPMGQGWTRVDAAGSHQTLDYCMTHPTLVRATLEWGDTSSDLAALAAYGQAGKRRNNMRLWLSQPELVWISRFARVTINSFWVDQSGYGVLGPGAALPDLFAAHPESDLSFSAGLVAMNHYAALATARFNQHTRMEQASVWGVWLHAMDRAQMFVSAMAAHEAGFHVERYGDGSLMLRVPRSRLDELISFKREHGFMHPDLHSLQVSE